MEAPPTLDGTTNVDFADVRTVMNHMGRALMGTGCAKGEGRARIAAEQAITSPLLDNISVEGATGVLINIVGGPDMKMKEIQEAASLIQEQAHEDANIIFGASIDESMNEVLKVTVIATGFEAMEEEIPIEVTQQVRRSAERTNLREGFAPATSRSPSRPDARSEHGRDLGRELAPAFTTRRPAAAAAGLQAAAPRESGLPPVRDRITFPSSNLDTDWDVPAFQRRQNG